MRNAWWIVLVCFLGLQTLAVADSLYIDSAAWRELAADYDYSEVVEVREPEPSAKPVEETDTSWLDSLDFLGDRWVRVLFISVVVGALMLFIIVSIVRSKASARIDGPKVVAQSLDEAEDNLPDVELNQLLQRATDDKNWRIALRIHFLMLLQQMIHAELIKWKKRKTNRAYISEIDEQDLRSKFAFAVEAFDPVWYGTAELDATHFHEVKTVIESLTNHLKDG